MDSSFPEAVTMSAAPTKTSARVLLGVTSILFTLLLVEIGLRLFRPINYMRPLARQESQLLLHQASSNPGLPYEMAPSREFVWQGVPVKTNSYGMRGDEPISAKSDSLGHDPPRDLIISPWDDHPTRLGHELAARAIAEKLLAERSPLFNTGRLAAGR